MSYLKNLFLYAIIFLLRPLRKKGNEDHFLIVSTTGLGDTLWATPALRALRQTYPQATIGILTSPIGAEVFKNNPHQDELFVFRGWYDLFYLFFALRKKSFGTVLFFHTSQRSLLPLCAAIGIKKRIGTYGLQKGLDSLLTEALKWSEGHEIERRVDMVKAVGAKINSYQLEFFVQEEDRKKVKELVKEEMIVALHPGAKDRFKMWPTESFVQLAELLKKELKCTFIVTATPEEAVLANSVCRQIEGAKSLIVPLGEMAAALEKFNYFVTNDTGPFHLALAVKTPVIAVFAPTDPAICGPYKGARGLALSAPRTCFPCLKKKCQDPFCLRQITPEKVALQIFNELNL